MLTRLPPRPLSPGNYTAIVVKSEVVQKDRHPYPVYDLNFIIVGSEPEDQGITPMFPGTLASFIIDKKKADGLGLMKMKVGEAIRIRTYESADKKWMLSTFKRTSAL